MTTKVHTLQTRRSWCLVLLMLSLAAPGTRAQRPEEPSRRFVLASWRVENWIAVISYELHAPADSTYDVSIVLKRKSDTSFSVMPRTVSGDIGRGKFAGGRREIRWEYRRDLAHELLGNDYFFVVTAVAVTEERGWPWWYYAAGGVVAGGAIIAIVFGNSDDGGGGGSTSQPELPNPPSTRPQ